MEIAISFIVGVVVGAIIALIVCAVRARSGRDAFTAVSQEVIAESSKQIIIMAEQVLKAQSEASAAQIEGKKELIDQSIVQMNERLERLRGFVQQAEADRQKHYGELTSSLSALSSTTESLRNALAGSKRLGAWGERMTEDVLQLAGMSEGVNYTKQSSEAAEDSGKPDFTFFLPNDLTVNMDVKFPLEKALAYLDSDDDHRKSAGAGFVSAVRGHIRTVASAKRGYINPAGGTVNYAIVFIPNEQVYSLAMELDGQLMDEALKMRIVMCGPLTLYAMLSVIRSAAENANIVKEADEVSRLMDAFNKQWQKYRETIDKIGNRIDEAKKSHDDLVGTRMRMLEKPLEKIEELRTARGLPADSSEANEGE